MERKLIIAIALSILVMLFYSHISPKTLPPSVEETPSLQESRLVKSPKLQPIETKEVTFKETPLETKNYSLTFTDETASIKEIGLKNYPQPSTNEPLKLTEVQHPREDLLYIQLKGALNLDNHAYQIVSRGRRSIVYQAKVPEELEITKKFRFPEDRDVIELQLVIKNMTPRDKEGEYRIVAGSRIVEESPMDRRFMGISALVNGKLEREGPGTRRIRTQEAQHPGNVSWVTLRNKYFSIILKPFAATEGSFSKLLDGKQLHAGIDMARLTIPANSAVTHNFLLYVGANDHKKLESLNLGLEQTVGSGVFAGIGKLLLVILRFFYGLVHNWGTSIILLTLLISIVFYPLTAKSLGSMKQMQALQPEIKKLQQEHKGNPQKLNREMMKLYKEYKINPLGGCFPLLLQMPIFIALYQTLVKTVELRGAHFLWIKDLSGPDAAYTFSTSLPIIGNSINILPILMIVAMVIQQKISHISASTPEAAQQQKMMAFMPLLFGVIFYNLPSGLVLYWLTNTVLTTLFQRSIMKRGERKGL